MAKKKAAPAEEVAGEAPERPVARRAARIGTNTWWCSICGAGNRVGATPEPICGSCGTPLKDAE